MATQNPFELEANIGQFVEELKWMGGFNCLLANSLLQWADFDTRKGLYSMAMAKNTMTIVLNTIEGNGKGSDSANVTWKNLSTVYSDWKSDNGFPQGMWRLSDSVLSNVVVRKTMFGMDVGLDRRIRVPRIQYGKKATGPGEGSKLSLEEYAAYMEGGTTNMDARPLFGPSFLVATQKLQPDLADAVLKSLTEFVSMFGRNKTTGRANCKNVDASDLHSAATLGDDAEANSADVNRQVALGNLSIRNREGRKENSIHALKAIDSASPKVTNPKSAEILKEQWGKAGMAEELAKFGYTIDQFLK